MSGNLRQWGIYESLMRKLKTLVKRNKFLDLKCRILAEETTILETEIFTSIVTEFRTAADEYIEHYQYKLDLMFDLFFEDMYHKEYTEAIEYCYQQMYPKVYREAYTKAYIEAVIEMPEEVMYKQKGIETFAFQAEIAPLMTMIVNTSFPIKDTFFVQLINNSSDALTKILYQSLTDPAKLKSIRDLFINLIPNENERTLAIYDSGIGMTKAELINNLGTIAKSGTKAFLETLDAGADISLLGRYGLGFYTAYNVADKVTVISKHNDDEQYIWESSAFGPFTVQLHSGENIGRGTKIILHLKENMTEYCEEKRIKNLVQKYCQVIRYPIRILVEKEDTTEVEVVGEYEEIDKKEKKKKNIKKKFAEDEDLSLNPCNCKHHHLLRDDHDHYKILYCWYSRYINMKLKFTDTLTNRKKPCDLMRFSTSSTDEDVCSLKDYVSRMPEKQKHIYYITGDNKESVVNSALVELVVKRGFEVIFIYNTVDGFCIQQLKEYNGKTPVLVTDEGLELPEDEKKKTSFTKLCQVMKLILGKKIKKVVVSNRLISSPCCVVSLTGVKNLEINPDHSIIKTLREKTNTDKKDALVKDVVNLLLDTSPSIQHN